MRNNQDGYFKINGQSAVLEFKDKEIVDAYFDPITKLPTFYTFKSVSEAIDEMERGYHMCVSQEQNNNMTYGQKIMLRWHWRLGHRMMSYVKWLARIKLLGKDSITIMNVKDHNTNSRKDV